METESTDPHYTIWEAVASLEREGFTKEEISDALWDVSFETLAEHQQNQ